MRWRTRWRRCRRSRCCPGRARAACRRPCSVHLPRRARRPAGAGPRDLLAAIRHPAAGRFVQVGIPLRLSVDAPAVKGPAPTPAPVRRRVKRAKAREDRHGIGADLGSIPAGSGKAEAAGPRLHLGGRDDERSRSCPWPSPPSTRPRSSLGTAVAIAFARNPMSLAYTDQPAPGILEGPRDLLGLGSQVRSAHREAVQHRVVAACRRACASSCSRCERSGRLERPGGPSRLSRATSTRTP